jgi:hypothetical protein
MNTMFNFNALEQLMCNHITLNLDENLLRPEHFDLLFQLQLKSSLTVSLEMLLNHPFFPAEVQDKSGFSHAMVDNYIYFKTEISNSIRPTSLEDASPLMLAVISDNKQAMFNIMKEYCPSFKRTERGIEYVFKLFQRKYNFLFRVKDLWYLDGYDLPSFSRLSRAQKKNMTLQDVPKVTAQQKVDMFDDLELTFNFSSALIELEFILQTTCIESMAPSVHAYFQTANSLWNVHGFLTLMMHPKLSLIIILL